MLVSCSHTYQDLLYIQVCSDPTPMHCITAEGKVQIALLSAAVQKRLTIGWCPAKTLMKICSSYRCAVSQHKCTAILLRAKCIPTAQCCTASVADSRLVSLHLYL